MDEREKDDPLRDLGERLDKARRGRTEPEKEPAPSPVSEARRALGIGLRMGLELVVAVFVGTGLGWAFDDWLGTRPWGLIIFFFLGIAAGMVNVYRAVTGMGMAIGYRRGGLDGASATPGAAEKDEDED
jgi:ATP synthase protein I